MEDKTPLNDSTENSTLESVDTRVPLNDVTTQNNNIIVETENDDESTES